MPLETKTEQPEEPMSLQDHDWTNTRDVGCQSKGPFVQKMHHKRKCMYLWQQEETGVQISGKQNGALLGECPTHCPEKPNTHAWNFLISNHKSVQNQEVRETSGYHSRITRAS